MNLEGSRGLITQLSALEQKALIEANASVVVGFTQNYGIFVHENLDAKHAPGKQAKFLEAPARYLQADLGKIASSVTKQTGSILQGLLVAGLRLLREAQSIVPVDTSALRASGFVATEGNATAAAEKAYGISQQIKALHKKRK